uniref:Central tail fiber J n=1 Tax=Pseudomonas phage vB_PaeS_HTN2 TaxID=3236647 RepID=A0AB39AI11_9VIRU
MTDLIKLLPQDSHASLVAYNQFDIHTPKQVVADGKTLYELLEDLGFVKWDDAACKYERLTPFVVQLNGDWLLESEGQFDYMVQPGDAIRVERLAGKGKKGGSKGLGIITAIAAIVAAPFTGGASLWLLVASAALLMPGMAGVPKPQAANLSGKDGASPTYSLTSSGNQARLLSAVPRLYGRMRFTPDLASQPYTEFEGNEQYLYQLFALSCGEVELHNIYMDQTPLGNFTDVKTELVQPYQAVTLFPDNVVTSEAVQGIKLENGLLSGPYIVGQPGTITTRVGLDFVWPGGCYHIDDQGNVRSSSVTLTTYIQQVNDQGQLVGQRRELGTGTQSFATQTPQRITHIIDVPPGRYALWATRAGLSNQDNSRIQNDVQWAGLRAYLKRDDGFNYGNVTLLALKMKATEVLNSSTMRAFTVEATGKVQTWSPAGGWTPKPVADNTITWAAADILHNADYGKGLATSRIDMAGLYRLHDIWKSRGDTFNGIFDTTISVWEALQKVLRAGRAAPIYYAGKVEFIREEPQSLPVQMFQPRNIVQGSLSFDYNWPTSSTPNYVIIQYLDSTTWTRKEVECKLPNVAATKAATVELFGVTNRDQAYREGMFLAASNRYRRRNIRFSVEMEGQIVRYNDLIQISHDVADWGYSGVVKSFNAQTGVLRTTEPILFPNNNCVIAFRKRDGSAHGPFPITPDPSLVNEPNSFGCIVGGTVAQRQAIYISDGVRSERTLYQAGPVGKAGLKALVNKVQARGDDTYNITALEYIPHIYTMENGLPVPPPESGSNLPRPPVGPIVDQITVTETTNAGEQAIQWTPAVGATSYQLQYSIAAMEWNTLVDSTQRTAILANIPPGEVQVRVRAIGATAGPWATWSGELSGSALGLPEIAKLETVPGMWSVGITWELTPNSKIIAAYTTIVVSTDPLPGPANSKVLGEYAYPITSAVLDNVQPGQRIYVFAAVTDKAGRQGPWYNNMGAVEGKPTEDPNLLLPYLTEQIGRSQLTKAMRDEIDSIIEGGEGLQSQITNLATQTTDGFTAVAAQFSTVQAQIDNQNTAIAQITQEVEATLDGAMKSLITLRTQLRSDGKLITAGIGIGVVPDFNDPTQHNSEIILQAGRIAFTTSQINDPLVTPLVVEGSNVYMHGAFIRQATIASAQIADASISSAKIQDLSVSTIKIAGNAVTIPNYNRWDEEWQGSPDMRTCLSLNLVLPNYGGVVVTWTSVMHTNGTVPYRFRILVDGAVEMDTGTHEWAQSSLTLSIGRFFNAGTYNIEVQCQAPGAPGRFVKLTYQNLLAQAAMR